MSNQQMQPYVGAIKKAEKKFAEVSSGLPINYDRECIFAMQALMKTEFAMKVANQNPQSVHLAMINVGSTGLTLNPANGYAYLVPRDGQIVLDISYKGLIKIATDSGAIAWARADIVHEQDRFEYHGPARVPDHTADPFSKDRGGIVGCYCIAKTKDGDILTEVMPIAELEKIRDKSMAWAKKKSGPWKDWFEQMAKKAVIKRASKTWPYTDERLAQAVEVANTGEGGYALQNEPGFDDADDYDPTWKDAMDGAGDVAALKAIKAEMCQHWTGAHNIPKGLIEAYNKRLAKLQVAA